MNRKAKKNVVRKPRTPRVDPSVGALYAIATAIDRHAQAIESVRDAILEASGKMPPPEFVGEIERAERPEGEEPVEKTATDDANVEDQREATNAEGEAAPTQG